MAENEKQQQERIIEAEEKDRRKDPHGIDHAKRAEQGEPKGYPSSERMHAETDALPDPRSEEAGSDETELDETASKKTGSA
ncbi:MAG: hypothetical protein AB7Q01_12120 [Gammaproteobacteria bacterium]